MKLNDDYEDGDDNYEQTPWLVQPEGSMTLTRGFPKPNQVTNNIPGPLRIENCTHCSLSKTSAEIAIIQRSFFLAK